jgi:hypothetical protein
VRTQHLANAFVRVRVLASDQDDISEVEFSEVLTFGLLPRQQRLRAHIVVDQRPTESVPPRVGKRAMQQVAVEDQRSAGGHLHGDGVALGVGVAVGSVLQSKRTSSTFRSG